MNKSSFLIISGLLSIILFTSPALSLMKLQYYITLKNNDSEVYCDLLTIKNTQAFCRQSRGMTIYPYNDLLQIRVNSGNKSFVFNSEIIERKAELTDAFNALNQEKLKELGEVYEAKQEYLAQKRKEELDRLRQEARSNSATSINPDDSTGSRSIPPSYGSSDCEDGHWIDSVSRNGEIIILENRSVWQVDNIDKVFSRLWLPTSKIIVCGDIMINTDDGEKIGVTRLR